MLGKFENETAWDVKECASCLGRERREAGYRHGNLDQTRHRGCVTLPQIQHKVVQQEDPSQRGHTQEHPQQGRMQALRAFQAGRQDPSVRALGAQRPCGTRHIRHITHAEVDWLTHRSATQNTYIRVCACRYQDTLSTWVEVSTVCALCVKRDGRQTCVALEATSRLGTGIIQAFNKGCARAVKPDKVTLQGFNILDRGAGTSTIYHTHTQHIRNNKICDALPWKNGHMFPTAQGRQVATKNCKPRPAEQKKSATTRDKRKADLLPQDIGRTKTPETDWDQSLRRLCSAPARTRYTPCCPGRARGPGLAQRSS